MKYFCVRCGYSDIDNEKDDKCMVCAENERKVKEEYEELTRNAELIIEKIGIGEATIFLRYYFNDPNIKKRISIEHKKKLVKQFKHLLE